MSRRNGRMHGRMDGWKPLICLTGWMLLNWTDVPHQDCHQQLEEGNKAYCSQSAATRCMMLLFRKDIHQYEGQCILIDLSVTKPLFYIHVEWKTQQYQDILLARARPGRNSTSKPLWSFQPATGLPPCPEGHQWGIRPFLQDQQRKSSQATAIP